MAGTKVRCSVCKHQANAFCLVKKCQVSLNKRRKCDKFGIDIDKIKAKKEIPTTRGLSPSLFKDARAEYKKAIKREAARQAAEELANKNKYADVFKTADEKYPLTGDLSRFISSAEKG